MVLVLGIGLMMVAQLLRRYHMVSSALAGARMVKYGAMASTDAGRGVIYTANEYSRYCPCFDESSSIPKSFAVLSWK